MQRPTVELKKWRIIALPLALLFIPVSIYFEHAFLLCLLGVLTILFIGIDIYRIFTGKRHSRFYKAIEFRRFSSKTSFLVAIFIVFLLFPVEIAYLCLAFIILGDLAAKFTGMVFGRNVILQGKTLEGSLGFLTGCFYAGSHIGQIFDIGFTYLLAGAVCATLSELFSINIDDNFTVGILTGGCLMALKYFQVI